MGLRYFPADDDGALLASFQRTGSPIHYLRGLLRGEVASSFWRASLPSLAAAKHVHDLPSDVRYGVEPLVRLLARLDVFTLPNSNGGED